MNVDVRLVSYTNVCRGNVSLLACLKNALQLFVQNKSNMNPEHEFAVVVLTQEAHWVRGYLSLLALSVCHGDIIL